MPKIPRSFLWAYLSLLILSALILISFSKGELELLINRNYNPYFDAFFTIITNMGDGVWVAFLCVALLTIKYNHAIALAIGGVIHALIIFVLKRFFFNGEPRPATFLNGHELHFVDHINLAYWHTFPSGHTATAFLIAAVISYVLSTNTAFHVFCVALATLIGFSRIYLLQHFGWDVWAGSIIGVLSALIAIAIVDNYFQLPKFNRNILIDKKHLRISRPKPRKSLSN